MQKRTKTSLLLICVLISTCLTYNLYPIGKIPPGVTVDKIVVVKSERKLLAFADGRIVKTYTIALGRNPIGKKQYEGDKRTPEGVYFINDKRANSKFYKNLGISYPNDSDLTNARTIGKPAGGDVKIHGLQNGLGFIGRMQAWADWTAGCIALTNQELDDLYAHTEVGTPIEIRP